MDGLPDLRDVQSLASIILAHMHSIDSMWYFTDHGCAHSKSVLTYIEDMIEICEKSEIDVNEAEKCILRCSAWLHDIGRMRSNDDDDHAAQSVIAVRKLCENGFLNLGAIQSEIEYVILTHSSKGWSNIKKVPKERPLVTRDKVRLQFMCALFKLADECNIERTRAPKPVYEILKDKMGPTSDEWWLRHADVIMVELSYDEKKVLVHLNEGCDSKIADSLKAAVEDPKMNLILTEYGFPIVDYAIQYHPRVDI